MVKPQVAAQILKQKKKNASSVFDDLMAATKSSLTTHHSNTAVATFNIFPNRPVSLDQVRMDLKTHGVSGLVRYGGSRTKTQFILQSSHSVPHSLVCDNRSYSFRAHEEKIRTAMATIMNIPFGAGPIIAEWVRKLGNVVDLQIPDDDADISTGRGIVKFSHIFFDDALIPAKTILSLPNQAPVFLKFANYVIKEKEFFLADAPTRINLVLNRAIKLVVKKANSLGACSYAEAVKKQVSPVKPPKPLNKPQKRSREDLCQISPTSRSPPQKKPLISVLEEAQIPEVRIKVNSPAEIFELKPPIPNFHDHGTPMQAKRRKGQNHKLVNAGRGKPLFS